MTMLKKLTAVLGAALALAHAQPAAAAEAVTPQSVTKFYADLAETAYGDAASSAKKLDAAVANLLKSPTPETLAVARDAWKAARVPYLKTEGFRFGNKVVDDWEGRVNSWPLDEGLIDYVDAKTYGETKDDNPLYFANVIANKTLQIGPDKVDATTIDKDLLRKLHQALEVEANVATGYHAIEFLLWGQDLNGTGPGAGNRPATDFDLAKCTGGNCDRRRAYLTAATGLLVDDLDEMTANWKTHARSGRSHSTRRRALPCCGSSSRSRRARGRRRSRCRGWWWRRSRVHGRRARAVSRIWRRVSSLAARCGTARAVSLNMFRD